jgi:hypothetical protein
LQLTIGRFGWFHRYEDYALIFLALLCAAVVTHNPRIKFPYLAVALILCAWTYIVATLKTPFSSRAVYLQQYQMKRFVTEFHQGSYAVNDIGLMSFQRTPGVYVLDVFGLASPEAAAQREKSAAWLAGIVQAHNIDFAILYPQLFHIPPAWTPVATMCVQALGKANLAHPCVVFYSTNPAEDATLRQDLVRFSTTLPKHETFAFLDPTSTPATAP